MIKSDCCLIDNATTFIYLTKKSFVDGGKISMYALCDKHKDREIRYIESRHDIWGLEIITEEKYLRYKILI